MKQMMRALFVLVVLSLVATPGDCTVTAGAPAIILEPDFSFGKVAEGNKVDHTFSVQNRGDTSLFILRVESG